MIDEKLFPEIIKDNLERPFHKGLVNGDEKYKTVKLHNVSCGDILTIQTKVKDGKIEDVRHNGTGCAICCASASIMCKLTNQKKIEDVKKIQQTVKTMLVEKKIDDEKLLGEAIVFKNVGKIPIRIKCANLAWEALEKTLIN
ncbi:MAG: SUF system NifU family Fe-S cluster assembly protein [Pseudomonadales bacterium]|jgi:SUF system NifU family Fe-S assembly protein|nr:SUF system NifU family Fe-S cluster assembly protein [Pseudomonadales bacterium]